MRRLWYITKAAEIQVRALAGSGPGPDAVAAAVHQVEQPKVLKGMVRRGLHNAA